jgi:putative peptidoglycan lipid II flippase
LKTALRRRIAALQPDHKRIAKGAAWVALFVLVGKLAGAAKEIAVAYRYGVSGPVDAYQLATTLITWLPGTLVSVLSIVLVPMFVRLRQQDAAERRLFFRELQGSVLLIGTVLSAAGILLALFGLPILAGKLSPATRQMAWQFVIGMAPVALLTLMIGVYAARLMARERQANTLLESVPAATILVFVLLWAPGVDIGPLLWGTLVGIAAQSAWLSRLARRADGESARPLFSWRSPHWHELRSAAAVMAVGQFVMSFITPLDQYTAALLGDSSIATLGYANRVIALLLGLGAMAIGRAALPVMADLAAAGQTARAHRIAIQWAVLMLVAGTVVAAVGWLLAPWAIQLLFERGAFTAHDTEIVAGVFRWGLVQVPFYFTALVFVQLLASRGRYDAIALFAASNLAVKFVLNFALSARMGIAGIALATGLMYAWSAGCLYCAAVRTHVRA